MEAGSYRTVPVERVEWGVPAAKAIVADAKNRDARRVLVVASATLARNTSIVSETKGALGERFAALYDGCKEHSPLDTVLACALLAHDVKPDLIATIGGGSHIDTAKIVQLCLTHDIRTMDALLAYTNKPTTEPSVVRQIMVPTTLSGAEFGNLGGALDTTKKLKTSFIAPDMVGRVIALDPWAATHTPEWLWLSTAIRSVDHAIEGYCALRSNPFIRGSALHALRLFAQSLRRTKADPNDLDARLMSLQAVWLATSGLARVPMGASHGIGYLLGSMGGVPHGYTSCVMLPAVLKWNAAVNVDIQPPIADALGRPDLSAADAVAALLDDLQMPRTLKDVGIGDDLVPRIAEQAAKSPAVANNPRPVKTPQDALEILALASRR
ncbi:MAG: iron-containing alcohol dehydrogenase [Alphaproteobacteria bacterium]|nr:iron-containing alcohol dehydrogenase [Alphaproteobacteria bacterium]MBL6940035.1 iron-containing alcohol dehydrogenase [Alphaproteobacteria bacterium]MBL7098109.1 iron-containing alcohol dehydrogenase [Alphaproteobacteria bacterium]